MVFDSQNSKSSVDCGTRYLSGSKANRSTSLIAWFWKCWETIVIHLSSQSRQSTWCTTKTRRSFYPLNHIMQYIFLHLLLYSACMLVFYVYKDRGCCSHLSWEKLVGLHDQPSGIYWKMRALCSLLMTPTMISGLCWKCW